ncbi:MAG TPA: hypothetical protein VHA10_12130 [Hypericibacter adhaerens]|jgi:hypothetical protein|uniref:Uncharacterized protein n=1 Tax=Hypericibacter adhaerens TaxID=2602016 RepID=A0A5J6MYJ7_9PROT|nr:hypothetical protein [Hypericibacter adhaerens]QEX22224.1 hypothetical protein FRZ61_21540 [Hypericibacter adhaerens]HWA43953.1 hypothetical protein [Hypericibacter adhaerens]
MRRVTMETLRRMAEELPGLPWPDAELEGLVAPRFGVITGFPEFLAEVEALDRIDLGAAGLPAPPGRKPKPAR